MEVKLTLDLPSLSPTRFVEYKRSFLVRGKIISNKTIPNNCRLIVKILDSNNRIIRMVQTNHKYGDMYLEHPDLIGYKEELDPQKEKLKKFGFSLLCVKDGRNPLESLRDAGIKAFYSDTSFEATIISASNKDTGALFDDGFNFYDENKKPYKLLKKGIYHIEVMLLGDGVFARSYESFEIGRRKNQLICRFNPVNHHEKMTKWCQENNYSIINDTLPGYLDPYLGVWYYHMGITKTYNANDLALFENVKVRMFDYLMDETSTSYSVELPYLQQLNIIDNPNKFHVYHYDIGEANLHKGINGYQEAKILKFKKDEYLYLYRIDLVNDKAIENKYFLDEKETILELFNLNKINIPINQKFAICGVIKPYKQDLQDFVFDDNSNKYLIKNRIEKLKYTFKTNGLEIMEYRNVNMERIADKSIGYSYYEFYNIFSFDQNWLNKNVEVNIVGYDTNNKITPINTRLKLNVVDKI